MFRPRAAGRTDQGPRRRLRTGTRPSGRRMSAGRGDRAAPPAPDGHWEVRFADAASAKGWGSLAQQARENTYRAWITMRTAPRPATETPRHHRLKGGLAHGTHRGQT